MPAAIAALAPLIGAGLSAAATYVAANVIQMAIYAGLGAPACLLQKSVGSKDQP